MRFVSANFFLACFLWCVLAGSGSALESRIVFVVGNTPVFLQEFDNRTNFVLLITGSDPAKAHKGPAFKALVIKGMVDEILQFKAAEAAGIKVSDREVESALLRLAKGNRMDKKGLTTLFAANHVPLDVLKKQLKTQIAWSQYIQQKYMRDVMPSKKEIDRQVQRLHAQKGKVEYRLAEIILHTQGRKKSDLFSKVEQIVQLLQQGAPFAMVARQFSESRSAMDGGYLGWLQEGDLDSRVLTVIEQTPIGSMTVPVETPSGYSLFMLIGKRRNSGTVDRHTIENMLQQSLFELASRKELAHLRRMTMIQYRLKS